MGTLYVVATPIGNLGDLSARAVETLRRVTVVAAEDTRVTARLLTHVGASPRLISYHEDSPRSRLNEVLSLLDAGDVALVTDAGTPGLSDPGAELVREAAARGHAVAPIPGPSAVTALLSVTGFPSGRFLFVGFLPRTRADRLKLLRSSARAEVVTVCFETPHRLQDALRDMVDALGARRLVIGRELTKLHEEIFRGNAEEALRRFNKPRGEFVIAIEGSSDAAEEITDADIETVIAALRQRGLSGRTLVERAAVETGAARSRVYRISLQTGRTSPENGGDR
jgi:16S rRNA (cytidine1402-2'-O)-methyltransferase